MPPVITFTSVGQTSPESAGAVTITAQLDVTDLANVVLPFTVTGTAVNPTDFTITASPITITPGNLTGSIVISVVNDGVMTGNRTVIVTMGTPTNATIGAIDEFTLTITDDDATPVYPDLTPLQINQLGMTQPYIKMYTVKQLQDGTYTIQTSVIKEGLITSVTNANGYASAAAAKTAINLLTAAYIDTL